MAAVNPWLLRLLLLLSDALRTFHSGTGSAGVALGAALSLKKKSTAAPRSYAAVYAEAEEAYEGVGSVGAKQSVELLRFVTAYHTDLEALVDVTPYSPLLQAALEDGGNVTLYTFIDTWVGNGTGTQKLYMNNASGVCTNVTVSDGNGWLLSAEFLFWPPAAKDDALSASVGPVDTRPHTAITLASGAVGSNYRIGEVSVHPATFDNITHSVLLDEAINFGDAKDASVYKCGGEVGEIKEAALLGYLAQRAHHLHKLDDKNASLVKNLRKSMGELFGYGYLIPVDVEDVFANRTVRAKYNATLMKPMKGSDVYYSPSDVFTDQIIDEGGAIGAIWWNSSVPLVPFGRVLRANNGTMELQLDRPCMPRGENFELPRLLIPQAPDVLARADAIVAAAMSVGLGNGSSMLESGSEESSAASLANTFFSAGAPPLLLRRVEQDDTNENETSEDVVFVPEEPIGNLDLQALVSLAGLQRKASLLQKGGLRASDAWGKQTSRKSAGHNETVCVVVQKSNGHVFARDFQIPTLDVGDRVLAQLAVTGHGWASTTEQCGEYCHAVYSLSLNGHAPTDVSQFRDDCKNNPIGEGLQHGTWWESRNGWCPGSVEPGVFLDVTDLAKQGANNATLKVSVYSNVTGRYQPYTDYAGFAFGDAASLTVGMSLFVYSKAVVNAVRAQSHAYTAAELALRSGVSAPDALNIPAVVQQPLSMVLVQESKKRSPSHGAEGGRFDFEATAPWYFYNSSSQGPLSRSLASTNDADFTSVRLFTDRLMQSNSRTVTSTLSKGAMPSEWGRVALHLRLAKPPGDLDFDHWDRLASFGVLLPTEGRNLKLQPSQKQSVSKTVGMAEGRARRLSFLRVL